MKSLKELLRNNENYVRAPDRNPLIAPQADLAKTVKNFLNQYETKKLGKIDSPWNRYGSGHSFGDLLFGESPELLDDMSYGKNPLTSGGITGRLPIPDKRLLDMPVPIPATGGLGVIKNKGGNWLTGSVENALKGLKRGNQTAIDDAGQYGGFDVAVATSREKDHPINSWIDNTLTKYVKNRMATPDDEVRKLADQGILHYEPPELSGFGHVRNNRERNGFPIEGMAESDLARNWETRTDWMAAPDKAKDYLNDTILPGTLEENSWLSKVDPESPVHYYSGSDDLGWRHLIDELLNATNPESGLPMNLRMKPEGFKGLTMEEAVKKVNGINQHRVLQAEAARKQMSRAEGIPTTKTYDDGFRFVAPDDVTKNKKHREYVVDAGKRGAWCTQGGMCDHYAGGNSRVQVLLDDFGNPHAQIAIETEKKISSPYLYLRNNHPDLEEQVNERFENYYDSLKSEKPNTVVSVDYRNQLKDEFAAESSEWQNYLQEHPKQKITEIKPLGNSWDHEKVQELMAKDPNYQAKIQEKLQDFVKSGNWSDVGDLQNTGLRDILKPSGRTQSDNDKLLKIIGNRFATDDQINNGMEQLRKLRIKNMFDEQD